MLYMLPNRLVHLQAALLPKLGPNLSVTGQTCDAEPVG